MIKEGTHNFKDEGQNFPYQQTIYNCTKCNLIFIQDNYYDSLSFYIYFDDRITTVYISCGDHLLLSVMK